MNLKPRQFDKKYWDNLGDGFKKVTQSELKNKILVRKSIYAKINYQRRKIYYR